MNLKWVIDGVNELSNLLDRCADISSGILRPCIRGHSAKHKVCTFSLR
jgi:hypothetical protein